jgi:hypothetical protein
VLRLCHTHAAASIRRPGQPLTAAVLRTLCRALPSAWVLRKHCEGRGPLGACGRYAGLPQAGCFVRVRGRHSAAADGWGTAFGDAVPAEQPGCAARGAPCRVAAQHGMRCCGCAQAKGAERRSPPAAPAVTLAPVAAWR